MTKKDLFLAKDVEGRMEEQKAKRTSTEREA